MSEGLRLVVPGIEHVASYREALVRGWNPDGSDEVTDYFVTHLDKDVEAHLARSRGENLAEIALPGGGSVPFPPMVMRWVWDGGFCGYAGLTYMPGTFAVPEMLPNPNHIGILLVPWKQGLGYGKTVLALMLEEARAIGMREVILTCDVANIPAGKNIIANGGQLLERVFDARYGVEEIARYVVTL